MVAGSIFFLFLHSCLLICFIFPTVQLWQSALNSLLVRMQKATGMMMAIVAEQLSRQVNCGRILESGEDSKPHES